MPTPTHYYKLQFWLNYKGSFPSSSITMNNCYSDIRSNKIRPTLSSTNMFWTKIQSILDHLGQITTILVTLVHAKENIWFIYIFLTQYFSGLKIFFDCFFHLTKQERLRSNKLGPYDSVWGQPRYHFILLYPIFYSFLFYFILYYFILFFWSFKIYFIF